MSSARAAQMALMGAFLALVCGLGLTQAGIDLRQGERPQVLDLFQRAPTEANLRAFEKDLGDCSWFVQNLRPWMQYIQYLVLKDAGKYALCGRGNWLFYKPGVQYLVEPWPPRHGQVQAGPGSGVTPAFAQANTSDPFATIVSFHQQLKARGIHLLVIPAPNKESVYPDRLTRRATAGGATHTTELIGRLRAAGVEVVDLFDLFAASREGEAPAEPRYYLAQDTHWSPEGMQLAAEKTASVLRSLGWVEPGTTAYDLKPVPVQRLGDIVRMMDAPRLERYFPAREVPCTQVIQRDTGAVYQDDPASEVLVLGDSFLRIYEKDEPSSGGFVAHLARALGRPLASIVNDGGASTLVRQELSRRPKLLANTKVVVWEFVERDIRFGTEGWQDIPLPKVAQTP